MTEEQYRNSLFRQELAEFLSSPAGINAIVILKDGGQPIEAAPIQSDPVVSVRILSQAVGWSANLSALLRLAEPNPPAVEPMQETWEKETPPELGAP